ncbi:MAG: MFS transporter [Clostridium sp.]|nr:MFS transporter [Clostridium sp.]
MFLLLLAVIYLAFISLGLPDSLLGAAWPTMYREFGVPVSYAGVIAPIVAVCTVISSLLSDRMTKKWGTGKVTVASVAITAISLFGYATSHSFWFLCLWSIPYGLGAGGVDASLNNYVALHYESRHMSWLHCMWGLGASLGPCIMNYALTNGQNWNAGYYYLGILQVILTFIIFVSLPLWKKSPVTGKGKDGSEETKEDSTKPLKLREIVKMPGAKEVMITFFCYCALEQTAGLWASSYLVLHHGIKPELVAKFASLFFIGITVGRAFSGFLTLKLNDTQMIRMGEGMILGGILTMLMPWGEIMSLVGFIVIGLGCAPIYPCIIHSTPRHFGEDKSQALIGVQMAAAYIGICLMPPLFGLIANHVTIALLPVFLVILLVVMAVMYEVLLKEVKKAG